MIGYVTLGTNNLLESAKFYDEIFQLIGASRVMETERFIAWASGPGEPMLSLMKPFDAEPATIGNGVMVALRVADQEKVEAVYARALALGGADEGSPGPRGPLFAAYFRDLDGNKLNVFCMDKP